MDFADEWELDQPWLESWRDRFEETALSEWDAECDGPYWCATDQRFDFLAHQVAVEAVSERQDGLTQDECSSVVAAVVAAFVEDVPDSTDHP